MARVFDDAVTEKLFPTCLYSSRRYIHQRDSSENIDTSRESIIFLSKKSKKGNTYYDFLNCINC